MNFNMKDREWKQAQSCTTHLTKELIHEGGVVHSDLHFIVIVITRLTWSKSKEGVTLEQEKQIYLASFMYLSREKKI